MICTDLKESNETQSHGHLGECYNDSKTPSHDFHDSISNVGSLELPRSRHRETRGLNGNPRQEHPLQGGNMGDLGDNMQRSDRLGGEKAKILC